MDNIEARTILGQHKVDCSMDVRNPVEILTELVVKGHLPPELLASQIAFEPIVIAEGVN